MEVEDGADPLKLEPEAMRALGEEPGMVAATAERQHIALEEHEVGSMNELPREHPSVARQVRRAAAERLSAETP